MKAFSLSVISFFLLIIHLACEPEPNYNSMVESGLQSGIQKDSLFLGYSFGMTNEEFRAYSWELNQQGLVTGFTKIKYSFPELPHSATYQFYPDFHENKIYRMPVTVAYDAWAPWNQHLSADSLVHDLIDLYAELYQADFRKVYVPDIEKKAYFAVSGNRAITIFPGSDMNAEVIFTDLNVKQQMIAQAEN